MPTTLRYKQKHARVKATANYTVQIMFNLSEHNYWDISSPETNTEGPNLSNKLLTLLWTFNNCRLYISLNKTQLIMFACVIISVIIAS